MSISCWLGPTSWWEYSTSMPKRSRARTVSRRTSDPASRAARAKRAPPPGGRAGGGRPPPRARALLGGDGRSARVRSRVEGREIEVAALIERLGRARVLEQEVL